MWRLDDFSYGQQVGKGKFGNIFLAKEKISGYIIALKAISREEI
jgi:serine/threonine protein kinase